MVTLPCAGFIPFSMLRLLFVILMFISSISLYAQNFRGTVYDAHTREPIPFCTIVLGSNTTNGTIANVNGDYIVNNAQQFDSIAFSAVGYERKVISVTQLKHHTSVMLQPRIYQIGEVVVKPINIDSLLHEIKEKIWESYPNPYPVLGGVYRKQMVENDKLAFIGECELYCTVKHNKKNSEYKVMTQNIVLTKNIAQFEQFLFINIFSCTDLYRGYRMFNLVKNWKLDEITTSDDGKSAVYVFCGTYNGLGKSSSTAITLQYHVNDNAVLSLNILSKSDTTKPWKKRFGDKLYYNSFKQYYKYSKLKTGKYVLKYARTEADFSLDRRKGEHIDCTYTMDYVVTNDNVSGISPDRKPNYDPFRKADGKVIEQSELRVIPPDYEQ